MISQPKFMLYVRHYREKTEREITNFAALTAYSEYCQGNKNQLLQRMEITFGKDIEDDGFLYGAKYQKQEKLELEYQNKVNSELPGVDYTNEKIVDKILDPIHNGIKKNQTFRNTYIQGYQFCLVECRVHGEAIYRVSVTKPRPGSRAKNNTYQGYCLYCQAARRKNDPAKRIENIRTLQNKFLAKLERLEDKKCAVNA